MAKTLYRGPAHGVPLNSRKMESRFPRGFILVDPTTERVWVYRFRETDDEIGMPAADVEVHYGEFTTEDGEAGRLYDRVKHGNAAAGPEFDVRAAPWVGAA
jgi:hypothetical protein